MSPTISNLGFFKNKTEFKQCALGPDPFRFEVIVFKLSSLPAHTHELPIQLPPLFIFLSLSSLLSNIFFMKSSKST